jgi:glycogen phosphorylase
MTYQGNEDAANTFISYANSGLQGLSLRVLPYHPHLSNPFELGLIQWA